MFWFLYRAADSPGDQNTVVSADIPLANRLSIGWFNRFDFLHWFPDVLEHWWRPSGHLPLFWGLKAIDFWIVGLFSPAEYLFYGMEEPVRWEMELLRLISPNKSVVLFNVIAVCKSVWIDLTVKSAQTSFNFFFLSVLFFSFSVLSIFIVN